MTTKREPTAVRRTQILDAARRLIIRYGSEHVTVKRIAKEVGISEPAVYRHFSSKRALLSLLVDNIEENLIADISRLKGDGATSLDAIDSILRNHISRIEQRRGVSFQVIAEIISLGDKKLNVKVFEVLNRYVERLKDLLAGAVANGEIDEDVDLETAAFLLFSMIQGLVNLWAISGYSFDPQERYTRLWQTYLRAIGKTKLIARS